MKLLRDAGRQLRQGFFGIRHLCRLVLRSRRPTRTTPTPATAAPVLRARPGRDAAEQRLDCSAHFLLHQVRGSSSASSCVSASSPPFAAADTRMARSPAKAMRQASQLQEKHAGGFCEVRGYRRGRPGARTRRRVVPAAGRTWRDARAPPHTCALARRACVVLAFASSSSPAPPVPERCVGTLPRQRMTATGRDCHVAARFSPHRPMPSAAMATTCGRPRGRTFGRRHVAPFLTRASAAREISRPPPGHRC